jgi:ABC-type multidrug transport system fused ATPase/permease subunit
MSSDNLQNQHSRSTQSRIGREVDKYAYDSITKHSSLLKLLKSDEFDFCYQYLHEYKLSMFALLFMGLVQSSIAAGLVVLVMLFFQLVIDGDAASGEGFDILGLDLDLAMLSQFIETDNLTIILIFTIFGIIFTSSFLMFWQNKLALSIQKKFTNSVRSDTFDQLMKFEISYFTSSRLGDIAYMQNTIINRFSQLVPFVHNLFVAIMSALFILIILFKMSSVLTIGFLFFTVSLYLLLTILRKKSHLLSFESSESSRISGSIFLEIVHGIRLIKQGGQEQRAQNDYLSSAERREDTAFELSNHNNKTRAIVEVAGSFGLLLFVYLASFFGDTSLLDNLGFSVGYFVVAWGGLASLYKASDLGMRLSQITPFLSIVHNYLNDKEHIHQSVVASDKHKIKSISKNINFSNVSFSYDENTKILDNISHIFEKGLITAVVGASGSGKSTLLELLSSFQHPNSGSILVDKINLNDIDRQLYRKIVGYVSQDSIMFHGSIGDNITFFNPDASSDSIEKSIRMACADKFIDQSNDGYDTIIGEKGLKISGGQRQRISLARVFLQDFDMLLLDEATSALDLYTESKIYKNLQEIKQDKIIVVAAHRLSAITKFDNIVVLNNGSIFETGSHEELMGKKGLYYDLFRIQEVSRL